MYLCDKVLLCHRRIGLRSLASAISLWPTIIPAPLSSPETAQWRQDGDDSVLWHDQVAGSTSVQVEGSGTANRVFSIIDAYIEGLLARTGSYPQALSGAIDWDTVDDAGFYTVNAGSVQTNTPTGVTLGACHVFTSQTYLVQIGWSFETSARTFTRTRPGGTGTPFGTWERIHIPINAIVELLEARTGDNRLNANALRLIADQIDAELGATDWRTGGIGSSDTAAQILAKLLTVDGSGSGLDADLLDGMTPAEVAALGVGSGFDLHDDVTDEITDALAASDRFVFSNENVAGAPNQWVPLSVLQSAIVSLNYLTVSLGLTTQDRARELIQLALAAAVTGNTEQNITVTHNADGTFDFAVIYPNQVTQADAEAGTSQIARLWTPQRVAQAIAALAPGGQTTGLNLAQVNARVQAGLMAAVEGNTETGIAVTYNPDGTFDFVVSGTTPTPTTHTRYGVA